MLLYLWVTLSSQEQLRTCLALGADRAILVETNEVIEPLGVAKALKEVVGKENPDLIILGKQAIDGDSNQTGQMLAALLELPQGTFASEVEIEMVPSKLLEKLMVDFKHYPYYAGNSNH